ncbi:hypothetical protein EB232_29490 [Mesorhizobium sp. NZP2077]|nr:hypothetical protein EB232_29490 [Mesorhizobium sp. NZP2077]
MRCSICMTINDVRLSGPSRAEG